MTFETVEDPDQIKESEGKVKGRGYGVKVKRMRSEAKGDVE